MRLAITAFIAGGLLLLFLPQVPLYWMQICVMGSIFCGVLCLLSRQSIVYGRAAVIILMFILGFAWNARYAENRLNHILASDLEGINLTIEGRVVALPQGNAAGAKFAFDVDDAFSHGELINPFPRRIYLSWQPAWRSTQSIPEIIPGQRWKLKVKLKRPYGSLNPYTFDFERWSFQQDFGASGSVKSGELLLAKEIGFNEFALAMELARWNLRRKIQSILSADARYAGVIVALVMGDQNAIDQDDWQIFNATGIGHLISIKYKIYLSFEG